VAFPASSGNLPPPPGCPPVGRPDRRRTHAGPNRPIAGADGHAWDSGLRAFGPAGPAALVFRAWGSVRVGGRSDGPAPNPTTFSTEDVNQSVLRPCPPRECLTPTVPISPECFHGSPERRVRPCAPGDAVRSGGLCGVGAVQGNRDNRSLFPDECYRRQPTRAAGQLQARQTSRGVIPPEVSPRPNALVPPGFPLRPNRAVRAPDGQAAI
jgi:hypothetical protein